MELNYKTFGHGPALFILHGLFGSLDNWVSLGRQLAHDFSIFLIDQRNHGRSPHADEWDYAIMASDLNNFMDDHGISKTHLLGHSMGGKTAMQFASDYPEKLEKLIVADMAPKRYPPHHTEILNSIIGIKLDEVKNRKEVDQQLQAGIPNPAVRQFLLKGLVRTEGDRFAWKFNLPLIYETYPNILEAIRLAPPFYGSTLFISGGQSNYVLKEDRESILESFPNALFEVLPEAGHWLHAEAPEMFLSRVKQFLLA